MLNISQRFEIAFATQNVFRQKMIKHAD